MSDDRRAYAALAASTLAFTVCFAAWVANGVLVTYLVSSGTFRFDESQIGWLLAVPVLTGALTRVPLGILTDRLGGRIVLTLLMLGSAVPMYLLSHARTYGDFLLASLGFGCAGGSFAVGIAFVSAWFDKARQGTALGIFGMGNAGAAATTLLAPTILAKLTAGDAEGWRQLPRIYAALLAGMAVVFFLVTRTRLPAGAGNAKFMDSLRPLASLRVWRFGLYYFLVFGAFVALAQWIVPYSVSVYEVSIAEAGLLASAFSLPSGVVRAAGGWLSDRFGARTVMYGVFGGCVLACALLSVPRMEVRSPGEGRLAKSAGVVTVRTPERIVAGGVEYRLTAPPERLPAALDDGTMLLPRGASWHEAVVAEGAKVEKKQLLARGVTSLYYPANKWVFAVLVLVFGIVTGIGKAGVYKYIPEYFPGQVGAVGGMVGLLGALGGFFLPPGFGYVLRATGLWSSCWIILTALSIVCLVWLHLVVRRMMREEAPDLARAIERRAEPTGTASPTGLRAIPFFRHLSEKEIARLAQVGRTQTAETDEVLFREGEAGDALYVILKGSLRVSRAGQVLATRVAGEFVGELALLDGLPRSATLTAVEPSELFLLDRGEFLALLSRSQGMVADLLVGLAGHVRASGAAAAPPVPEV